MDRGARELGEMDEQKVQKGLKRVLSDSFYAHIKAVPFSLAGIGSAPK